MVIPAIGRLGRGAVLAVAIAAAFAVACLAVPGLAGLADMLYALVVVGTAVARRRRHGEVLELTMWTWVLAPGVRRVIDAAAGYDPQSFALLAAPLAALAAGWETAGRLLQGRTAHLRLAQLFLVLVAFAACTALVQGRAPLALGLAGVQLLTPLLLGVHAAAVDAGERTAVLDRFAIGVPLLVGGYGIIQFLVAPAWDAQWLRDVGDVAGSFGRPFPLEIRVFSTVNDPGSLAFVLVACLLHLFTRRKLGPLVVVAILLGSVCLGLTLVRSAWIAVAVGLLYASLRGWVKVERLVGAVIALGVALSVFATVLAPVVDRFTQSTSAGSTDESFQARASFQAQAFQPALRSPSGAGLASTGTAVRRDAQADQRFADTDSGYLELLRTFGGPFGVLLVAGVVVTVVVVNRSVRPATRGSAALAAVVPVHLVFGPAFSGVVGMLVWVALANASSELSEERLPQGAGDRQETTGLRTSAAEGS